MTHPFISVVIPAFNAGQYIQRLFDSLAVQTLQDFEAIVVNDGSTDDTKDVISKTCNIDSRFKLIDITNQGVSNARQTGLKNAIGDYIIFADADDWIEPDMLEMMYKQARACEADIVICDLAYEYKGEITISPQKPSSNNSINLLSDYFNGLHASCCNKLVRKSAISLNNISFVKGVDYGEDLLFNIELAKLNLTLSHIPRAFYHYVNDKNSSSLTKRLDPKSLNQDLIVYNLLKRSLKGTPFSRHALRRKSWDIVNRAFLSNCWSNFTFLNKYFKFAKNTFSTGSPSINLLMFLSCIGLYRPAYFLFKTLKRNR